MKILFYDIETFPIEAYVWRIYDTNAAKVTKDWELASVAWKFKGDKKIQCLTRADFPRDKTDKSLTKAFYKVISEADIIVAHNGDQFDNKKMRAKFLEYNLPPIETKQMDTKKMTKRVFGFTSNSLNDLAQKLGFGIKVPHEGIELWHKCRLGVQSAWNHMSKYNKQDVVLLEKLFNRLLPWSRLPVASITGQNGNCPRCGDSRLRSRGLYHTSTKQYRKLRCVGCGGYVQRALSKKKYKAI